MASSLTPLLLLLVLLVVLPCVISLTPQQHHHGQQQQQQQQRHAGDHGSMRLADTDTPPLSDKLMEEIRSQQNASDTIIDYLTTGVGSGQAYDRLALFTDTIGHRVSGSQSLADAITYMKAALTEDGLENVHGENATIPHWVRGQETLRMVSPRNYSMALLSLGTSVGTPVGGITAEVITVRTFEELQKMNPADVNGKIVVYNQQCDWEADPIGCYGPSVAYRSGGATEAAKMGAVASLIRSVTSFSIYSPHTGIQSYETNVTQIPTACITVEDAEMIERMCNRSTTVVLTLNMQAENYPSVVSENVVAEITGSTYPDQVVLVSGHLDSWDVGQGAMDDGGGAFISWQALSAVHALGLRPKRTLRLVLWTCEEFGGIGSQQYYADHQSEASNFSLVMESDLGVFTPYGIQFTGNPAATAIMQETGQLLTSINGSLVTTGGDGTDIGPWMDVGVPGGSLANANEDYFFYHHSHGDTMAVMNSTDLDRASAIWAVTAFTIANLDDMLPKNITSASSSSSSSSSHENRHLRAGESMHARIRV
eukprot:TRINITY_DN1341_c0_g1_i2.p1 TRINITY_DN1341_c0_g1~~TRINITY_DN1341_c0_g1_i2.p1  ORF type:complete len:539 (+),score=129.24 TRINITY_DN1341_c0_g1_i2:1-1617(+)